MTRPPATNLPALFYRARSARTFSIVLTLTGLLAALPLAATTLEPMTGEELTLSADRVVVAQCSDAQSRWHGRALVTELTFTVSETLDGEAVDELVIAIPGGVDPERGLAVNVPGTPTIAPGEDFLLFLHELPETDLLGLVGLSQGAFPIVYDEGVAWVSRSRTSLEGASSLDTVKARIRAYLQNDPTRR